MALFLVAGLAGCGVKPQDVDPPQGKAQDRFPRVYPDPSTLNPPLPAPPPAAPLPEQAPDQP